MASLINWISQTLVSSSTNSAIPPQGNLCPIKLLPPELLQNIFKLLKPLYLARCSRVCRAWLPIVNDAAVRKAVRPNCFGAPEWSRYYGGVGIEPPLPIGIHRLLSSSCPFFKSYFKTKTIGETHMLVLIPATVIRVVNGQPVTVALTLRSLCEIVEKPLEGNPTRRSSWNPKFFEFFKKIADEPVSKSYWVLMTKDIIPNSQNKLCQEHEAFLSESHSIYGCQFPKAVEAAACIFTQYVSSEIRYKFYTRCHETWQQDKVDVDATGDPYGSLVVGGFDELNFDEGLTLGFTGNIDRRGVGIAPLLNLHSGGVLKFSYDS